MIKRSGRLVRDVDLDPKPTTSARRADVVGLGSNVHARDDFMTVGELFGLCPPVGFDNADHHIRNYPPPCQGGSVVIHPVHESRGTRRAYEAGIGRVGATAAAP